MPHAIPIRSSFTAGEISPLLLARINHNPYQNGCRQLVNFYVRPHGGAVRRPGTRFVAEVRDSAQPVRLIPFTFSVFQSYILELGHQYLRVYKDQGQVTSGATPYEIASPFTAGDLGAIKFCQSADRMFLVHRNHPPQELSRTGHTAWTLGMIAFGASLSAPLGVTVTKAGSGSGAIHDYAVTALDDQLSESLASSPASLDHGVTLTWANHAQLNWPPVNGAREYRIYKNKDNNGVYGYLGRTTATTFYDRGTVTPDLAETPPEEQTPFDSTDNYPGAVTFHEQRLCFGGTNNEPQTIWLSRTAAPTNLNRSSPALADDACQFTLNADQMNVIRWLVTSRMLLIGTSGAEWHMSGSDGGPITPASVMARRETQHGSADPQPVVIGNVVLFLDRPGRTVRGYVYQLDADGYAGPDLSILAEHLTRKNTIVDWAYQPSMGLVWAVRDDGVFLSLTFERDHEVVGWARHVTRGRVEAVAVIPGSDHDEVWLVVRRTINGQTRRFVERMEAQFNPDLVEAGQADTSAAFYVDSGLTYDQPLTVTGLAAATPVRLTLAEAHGLTAGDRIRLTGLEGPARLNGRVFQVASPGTLTLALATTDGLDVSGAGLTPYVQGGRVRKMVTTVGGLNHLAGERAAILADGAVHPERVVSAGGTIFLDWPAAVVHAGLPFESTLEPTPIEVSMPDGTAQGRVKRICRITARVDRSLGLRMGPDEEHLDPVSFRSSQDPMGAPPRVFSGDVDLTWPGGWEVGGRIVIRQDQPLPLTVLALIPRVHTSGR